MTVLRFEPANWGAADPSAPSPSWLTEEETVRRDRLHHPADRAAYESAHLLVRVCAAELLGRDPGALELVQRCDECGRTGHGAPAIRGEAVRVSLSHTRGFVAAIASTSPCGIDVERVGGPIPDRVLHPDERAWLRTQPDRSAAFAGVWTRKEALIKTGLGTIGALATIDALHPDAGIELGEWRGDGACGAWCIDRR